MGTESYQRIRLLASGGMGEVHLAQRAGPAGFVKPVVIKTILRHLKNQPAQVRQFLDEARLAALIDHPNVVQVFELGEDADGYFIVMEYVHGRSLRDVLRALEGAGRLMPPLIAARIVADALRGLNAAHGLQVAGRPNPIVHRDVSPENVLVSFSGVTKVTDFGIAKAVDAETHTRPGTLKGKLAYLAPEVIDGKPADPRSDVYAAGTVLFELLSGQPPFKAESSSALLRSIVSAAPPALTSLSPSCPQELDGIVSRALRKAPAERFSTAGEMCAELERFLFTAPVPVGSDRVAAWLTALYGDEAAERDALHSPSLPAAETAATRSDAPVRARLRPQRSGWKLGLGAAGLLTLAAMGWRVAFRQASPVEPSDTSLAEQAAVPAPPPIVPPIEEAPAPPPARTAAGSRRPSRVRQPSRTSRGKVRIQVRPWAEVFLEGRSLGITPLLEPVEVDAGRQVFVLKNAELGVARRIVVEVAPGKTVVLRADLTR